jgi:hypothetical protein
VSYGYEDAYWSYHKQWVNTSIKDALLSENLDQKCVTCTGEALDKTLTIQFPDEMLRMTAFTAKTTVTRCFGRRYTASRYTFSPPDRGNMVPNSSQTKSPQRERAKPRTQSIRDAPTDPTDLRIEYGVENIPVPMMAPTLVATLEILRNQRGGGVT